jgi:ATP-dependent Clp protease ATP-binding subunit ClpA
MQFSGACRRALDAANRDARRLRLPAVGTGHLLWSLLCDETCTATALLRDGGPDPSQLRQLMKPHLPRASAEEMAGTAPMDAGTPIAESGIAEPTRVAKDFRTQQDANPLPHSPALRRSLELALEEARRMGPSRELLADESRVAEVGTEHLLLGLLLQAEDSLAGLLLQESRAAGQ